MTSSQFKDMFEARMTMWKTVFTTIIALTFSLNLMFFNTFHVPSTFWATLMFISRNSSLIQIECINMSQIWIKKIVTFTLFKDNDFIIYSARYAKSFFWHTFALIFLGTCKVSVIIPTLNEEKYLSKCLRSINEQDFDGEFEIIVVDSGSTDRTVKLAKSLVDKIIVHKRRPVGFTRNLGVKFAEGDYIAFIDADTIASKGWLKSIDKRLSCANVAGVTGPTLPFDGSQLDSMIYKFSMGWLQHFSMIFGLPHVGAANCAYRREPFLRCGGFDEERVLSEDLALSLKIRHEGRLVFDKNMVAYTSTRRVKNYGYARLIMFYILNDSIFAITKRSLHYPPVR